MKVRRDESDVVYHYFRCPGCDDEHVIPTTGPKAWGFNGDVERPTFTPSILVRWKTWDGNDPNYVTNVKSNVCHSFVRDGRIEFLGDCTHALAGQTIEMADIA